MERESTVCPRCGATSASGSLLLAGSGGLEAVEVEVGYSELQSWLSKWDDVLHDYKAIEEAFTTEGTYASVLRHRLLRFFEDCWHLIDWIKRDLELPAAVRERVMKAATSSEPMGVCGAVANTSKHHTRWEGQAMAQVRAVKMPQGSGRWSPTVTITFRHPGTPEARNHDARTLATDCLSWWQSFIDQNELVVPWEDK